jgi:hypothetical protein
MGTRALTRVFEGDTELVCIYRQFDGYPDGLGEELRDFCAKKKVVNGISSKHEPGTVANGAGCLAAMLVTHLKGSRAGNVYIHPVGSKACGEEYEYHVKCPSYDVIDENGPQPIVVEGFRVTGGYNDKPRDLERVQIGDPPEGEPRT